MHGIHDVGSSSLSQKVELANHRPIVEVEIKCRFTDAELDKHGSADDADNKANAANKTEANKADDAVKVVEAVETKASKTNDAIEVVKTIAADVCCFDYRCGEMFAKQPMSQ